MSKKQVKRNNGMTAGVGHEGQMPPALKAEMREEKKLEKAIVAKERIVRGQQTSVPKFLGGISKDEFKALARAEIKNWVMSNNCNNKMPPIVKKYVHCLIDPCQANEVRIPDGKSRSTAIASTYNIFSVFGNFEGTDVTNNGRFCWLFTPTPLAFGFQDLQGTSQGLLWAHKGPPPTGQDATWTTHAPTLASFAAELNPSLAWDPADSFYTTVPSFHEKKLEQLRKIDPALADWCVEHPKYNGMKIVDLKSLWQLSIRRDELYGTINNSKLPPEKKTVAILEYGQITKDIQILASFVQPFGAWNCYRDQDSVFLVGTGSSLDPPSGSWTQEFTTGNARSLRPVAQSVWFENTQTEFNDAGDIAISFLPCGGLLGNIIPNGVDIGAPVFGRKGPLQNWEQHSTLPLQNTGSNSGPATSYVGKFKSGAYAWWLPEDTSDFQFYTPTDQNRHEYSTICVAGQIGSSAVGAQDPGILGQIHVNTVYEYETDEPNIAEYAASNYPGAMEQIALIMKGFPQCMSNDSHKKWWEVVLRALGRGALGFLTAGPGGALTAGAGSVLYDLK